MSFVRDFVDKNIPNPSSFMKKRKGMTGTAQISKAKSPKKALKLIRSNTTIFALTYGKGKGVVIAADRRTSMGFLGIHSDESEKVSVITPYSAIAMCGTVYVAAQFVTALAKTCVNFASTYSDISLDGQSQLLKNIMELHYEYICAYGFWGDFAVPLLAGYDPGPEKARIFSYEISGYFNEESDFSGDGCGWESIEALMDDKWEKNFSKNEAIKLAVKGMFQSGLHSHGVSDARIATPTIIAIDKNGIKEISKKVIDRITAQEEKEFKKKRGRR